MTTRFSVDFTQISMVFSGLDHEFSWFLNRTGSLLGMVAKLLQFFF